MYATCPDCDGTYHVGEPAACMTCGGLGKKRTRKSARPRLARAVAEQCGRMLEAYAFIQAHGLEMWMREFGEPSDHLFEATAVINNELDLLKLRAQLREVKTAREGK